MRQKIRTASVIRSRSHGSRAAASSSSRRARCSSQLSSIPVAMMRATESRSEPAAPAAALVDRMVAECEDQVAAIAAQQAAGSDIDTVARNIALWMDHNRELHMARLELELAAARDERIRERMTDAARVFWRMCEPLAAAAGSPDPERDGRGMAAMVDGLLLDRLAHPGQTHELLVEAVAKITAPRPPAVGGAPHGTAPAGAPREAAPPRG